VTSCQALPLPGHGHDGQVRGYVRICPAAHFRAGNVCQACAGNGAILCTDCPGEGPAILLLAEMWNRLLTEDVWERLTAASTRELVAEGAGPLLDPDCRAGKCGSCVGPPCEHECHGTGA